MRVLMLVLMSEGSPYDQFRQAWRRYMKSHPNIDCYFYMAKPNLFSNYLLTEDTLYIRLPENYASLWEKTVLAFRYFLNTRPNTYSFLYRPNASALVNLEKYYELCKTFPTQNFCSAVIVSCPPVGLQESPSGAGYTLSFDLVKRFSRDTSIRQVWIDDVTIGYHLREWKIPIVPADRFDAGMREYSSEELTEITSNHFHFRFRNDPRRDWDVMAMNMFVDRIYGKK